MKYETPRRACAALFAVAVLVAACGDDDGQSDAATSTTETDSADNSSTTKAVAPETTTTSLPADEENDPDAEAEGTLLEVNVSAGAVDGGGRAPIDLGETVTIRVTSDVEDSIHLHGYDVEVDITPASPADLTFDATIPGVFEVELEESGLQLLELEIS